MSAWERVRADELRAGDRFAPVRDEARVATVHGLGTIGPSARRIYTGPPSRDSMGRPSQPSIRPRHGTRFWRVVGGGG